MCISLMMMTPYKSKVKYMGAHPDTNRKTGGGVYREVPGTAYVHVGG